MVRLASLVGLLCINMLYAAAFRVFRGKCVTPIMKRRQSPFRHAQEYLSHSLSATLEAGTGFRVPKSIALKVLIEPELASHLKLKGSHRKLRLLLSTREDIDLNRIKSQIEHRIDSLTGQNYKLRYRMDQGNDPILGLINSTVDLERAVEQAVEGDTGIHLFVHSNPGIFPPLESDPSKSADTEVESAVEAVVHAMRAAKIDPEDSAGYTMVSFYGFYPIPDPSAFAEQLQQLWAPFKTLGRVYVAKEGVNAQMAVPDNAVLYFEQAIRCLPVFANRRLNTDHIVSREAYARTQPFRALHVRVRDQVLADGLQEPEPQRHDGATVTSAEVNGDSSLDWSKAGSEMPPLAWHQALTHGIQAAAGSGEGSDGSAVVKPIVLDCRNSYESDVGTFEGAVPLNTTFFRETWPVLEEILKNTPKDAPVLTYCTGGIRCVKVNAYLQQRLGFTNTHRLQGGIIAYNRELEAQQRLQGHSGQAGDAQLSPAATDLASRFKGVNYVFDERIGARVTEDILTVCEQCASPCDSFTNCPSNGCNVRFIQCATCRGVYGGYCSKACQRQHLQVLSARAAAEHKRPIMSRRLAKSTSAAAAPANSAETVTHPLEHAYNSYRSGVGCIDRDGGPGLLEALTKYCEQHSAPEPHTLAAVRDETLRLYGHHPAAARMLCDPLQGRVLGMLATITQAQRVLELGAFTGYSALALALGIEGTIADTAASRAGAMRKILSCEPDPAARSVALRHIAAAGLEGTVDVRPEKASVLLEQLRADSEQPSFDLVFVDADKKNYEQYVRTLAGLDGGRPLLSEGALIVVDNTLWKGLVLEAADASSTARHPAEVQEERNGIANIKVKGENRLRELAAVMHKFNVFVAQHPQLQPVLLPLRDGLTVIRYSSNQ